MSAEQTHEMNAPQETLEHTNMRIEQGYYFAYGSNLNPQRMKDRGVLFTKRELAQLNGYEFLLNKLRINGTAAANIRPKDGSTLYGLLYTCTPDVFQKLDVFEGVAAGHYSRETVVVMVNGRKQEAITYIASGSSCDDNLRKVDEDYLSHILCGKDLLPGDYVKYLESFSSWHK